MGKSRDALKRLIYKSYREMKKLVSRHGKIRVVFRLTYYDHSLKRYVTGGNLRRRLIHKNGKVIVSYKGADYDKWSGYSKSCFTCGEDVKDFKHALKLMRNHDGTWLMPIEIHYGRFLRKKVIL